MWREMADWMSMKLKIFRKFPNLKQLFSKYKNFALLWKEGTKMYVVRRPLVTNRLTYLMYFQLLYLILFVQQLSGLVAAHSWSPSTRTMHIVLDTGCAIRCDSTPKKAYQSLEIPPFSKIPCIKSGWRFLLFISISPIYDPRFPDFLQPAGLYLPLHANLVKFVFLSWDLPFLSWKFGAEYSFYTG